MPQTSPRRVAFLLAADAVSEPLGAPGSNDNAVRLPGAFESLGWQVARLARESVRLQGRCLVADAVGGGAVPLARFDLYFALGFGAAASFLDRMQLLRSIDQGRFVNTVDALVYQHGKASLYLACPDVPQPMSHVDNDPRRLAAIVAAGGDWVAKPPASSFGRDVFRVSAHDTNTHAILEHLTRDGRYAMLQEYVAAPPGSEKRTLIAAGELIGAYRKRPLDHRGNIDAGAVAQPTDLDDGECATLARLAAHLCRLGARFASADLIGGKVLEINVANPGWLATFEKITGEDRSPDVAQALDRWAHSPQP